MTPSPNSVALRVVTGEIDSRTVSTLLVIPTVSQPAWPPFQRVAESIASRGRQMPAHAHEHEEVLTYVTEGFASYQLEGSAADPLPQGSARFLTAPSRATHRVSPAQGGAIRWFNLVVSLPRTFEGSTRLQSLRPDAPSLDVDNVQVLPLVGPRAPMRSMSGLECQRMAFADDSTTFPRVGENRRAILYALTGEGAVDQRSVGGGDAVLIEGVPGVAIHGSAGFRAIFATAPRDIEVSRPPAQGA